VKDSMKKWYEVVIKPYIKDVRESAKSYKYSREITIVFMIGLFISAGIWGYKWWSFKREADAQKSLSECIYAYQEALQGKDESWPTVSMMLTIGYERHRSSSLAPYFLVFDSDTLLKQGRQEEAICRLDEAIKALPTDSQLGDLYKTKLSLIKMDSEDQIVREEGLKELNELAYNEKNDNRDMALYYLGLYHWSRDDLKEAQAVWQPLIEIFKKEKLGASPWAEMASTKLEQIV
jgi:tetratricopeptide (TPR) repeat protein